MHMQLLSCSCILSCACSHVTAGAADGAYMLVQVLSFSLNNPIFPQDVVHILQFAIPALPPCLVSKRHDKAGNVTHNLYTLHSHGSIVFIGLACALYCCLVDTPLH